MPVEIHATLTCPECGHQTKMEMPTEYCLFFHKCENCGVTLKPKPGDCCVFCSYADKKCPPMQEASCC